MFLPDAIPLYYIVGLTLIHWLSLSKPDKLDLDMPPLCCQAQSLFIFVWVWNSKKYILGVIYAYLRLKNAILYHIKLSQKEKGNGCTQTFGLYWVHKDVFWKRPAIVQVTTVVYFLK